MDPYKKYFNIDPEYFPAVNSEVIKQKPDLWKKFYPHDTFIKLIKDVISVLERKQKLNIWVEGAYGTGKSHAVLTLKHLLDAPIEETKEYFSQFSIDEDIANKFMAAKSGKKILTVHRYGSSNIQSDNDLVLAMQESIEQALADSGITNAGPVAMRQGIIKYLEDDTNREMIRTLIERGEYKALFGNRSVEDIIQDLTIFQGHDLHVLMEKLGKVSKERQIKIFSMECEDLAKWITETIHANDLKQIVFIWDEFTEYLYNNVHRLTGFQKILELSQTQPFCFIQVTHKSQAIVSESAVLDRYLKPTCTIQLPENMAFQLMGAAMQKTNDPVLFKEWTEQFIPDLEERTPQSRKRISAAAKIGDNELAKILPIHPYAASLLKYISEGFASNQRSMFDFIKNSNNEDENYGFQWFINNNAPLDPNPFLSIDMLWGFFYEKGKESLAQSIRRTLDIYVNKSKGLNESEQRVLKTILLFQAMSEGVAGGVEAFIPTQKNLSLAFEGTDLDTDAISIADKLAKIKILYKQTNKDGSFQYTVHSEGPDSSEIDKYKINFNKRSTSELISEGGLNESIILPKELGQRFILSYAGVTNLQNKLTEANNRSENDVRHIYVVVSMARDAGEGAHVNKKIKEFYQNYSSSKVVVVDASRTPLGREEFEKWIEHKAHSQYYAGKNNVESNSYSKYATGVLTSWRTRISNGSYVIYSSLNTNGKNVNNQETLNIYLKDIDQKRFPLAPEVNWNLNDVLWTGQGTPLAVECGAKQELKNQFKAGTKLRSIDENFGAAWQCPNYWEKHPSLAISRIKADLEELIQKRLENDGRISISEIYDFLSQEPYGILPNNFTSFLLGFLLKEYSTGEYTWSDNNISDNLDMEKFKNMIVEIIKHDCNPTGLYRDKYIVTMTIEEKAFLDGTSNAFGISRSNCATIEATRDRIRHKMRFMEFPLWTLEYVLPKKNLTRPISIIDHLIQLYCELANNNGSRTETDIAMEIGKVFMANPTTSADIRSILNDSCCREGMDEYLKGYRNGELISLAKQIDDHGQYINALASKYDADASKWVWKKETTDQRIDELVLEYQIAAETKKELGMSCRSYMEALNEWEKKANNIRIPFAILKSETPQITNLLSMLIEIHNSKQLTELQKESLLRYIKSEGPSFNEFYLKQNEIFKNVESFFLNGLAESDQDKIFSQIPSSFYNEEGNYNNLVNKLVSEYKKQQGLTKLRNLWKEKTNTDNPKDWSLKHRMPIILMVPDTEVDEWQRIFDILNLSNPDENQIKNGLHTLENADDLFASLDDNSLRDKAFELKILKDNAVVLDDIEEVKSILMSHLSSNPYGWLVLPQLSTIIDQMVKNKYLAGGYSLAMKRIDNMDADSVKKYLKDLIKSNPKVGIQIIKDK